MGDTIDPGAASRLAELALMAMQARGIPPTPENFTVWYMHQSGRNPALTRAIAAIDKSPDGFSPEKSSELFRLHCGGTEHSSQIQLVNERVGELVDEVTSKLGLASSQTRDYSERLSSLGQGLSSAIDPSELVALVRELESQTELMRRRASKLETELERNSREINNLKGDLANARRAPPPIP
jgi:diguanylate cyclase